MTPPGILVVRGGAIGDFVLTLPVLAALHAQFPAARLEVMGYRHIAQLAVAGGLAHDVRPIDARPLAGFFAEGGELALELQEYFARFAIIIAYLYDPDEVFAANVRRCCRAQFIAGPHRPDDSAGLHATEALLKPLERLAIFDADPVPRLRVAPSIPSAGREPMLAVHPGSGSESKNWPESKWEQLLDHLAQTTDRRILLVGGEAEGARLDRLAGRMHADRLTRAFQLPLVELAQRLAACEALVGHDSGITHLAAALGLPVLALWGDTAEAVWRPRGEQVRILRAPTRLADLEVQSVLRALAALPR